MTHCSVCDKQGDFWAVVCPSGDLLCTRCWGWAWKLGLNAWTLEWGCGSLSGWGRVYT